MVKIDVKKGMDSSKKVALRDEIRTKLKSVSEIEYAGRVLIDRETGEEVLYTGNIFVKFNSELDSEKCLDLLNTLGVRKISGSNNLYFGNLSLIHI